MIHCIVRARRVCGATEGKALPYEQWKWKRGGCKRCARMIKRQKSAAILQRIGCLDKTL